MLPELSNLLSWWQWAILAAIPPAIVLLYFLKLKRRPLEVPSTWLWHKSIEDLHVNSIWQRLRNNWLLYLQLAIVLAIILAVLRPSWQALHLSGSRLIILIDNSASMQATDVRPSRLEEAKRRAGELIDQLRSGDSAMLISFSDAPRVEQPFADDHRQLHEALAAIRPSQHSTNLSEALKLVAGLASTGKGQEKTEGGGEARTNLFIFSDGRFPPVPDIDLAKFEPTFVPIGRSDAANVGIVAFGVSRSEENQGKLQAYARLQNSGPSEANILVKLFLNDEIEAADADRVSIPTGETRGLAFDLADFDSGVLRIQAETGDQLTVDDQAWAVVSPPRRVKVLMITPKDDSLEKVLATKAASEVAEIEVEGPGFLQSAAYQDRAKAGAWDLVIYDRASPAEMPRANTFFIGSLPPAGGWRAKSEVTLPQIIDEAVSHPLMRWVDVNDIQSVIAATPLEVPGQGTTLIETSAGPLLGIAPRDDFQDLVLGMALVDEKSAADGSRATYFNTDWPSRASFASFVFNLLTQHGGGQDPAAAASYRPGMPATVEGLQPGGSLEVQTPSGEIVQILVSSSGKATFTATDELGVYRARSGGKLVQEFAVNLLDPLESDIRQPADPAIKIGYAELPGKTDWTGGRRDIWRELVLACLAIAVLEWFVYLRRVYF